MKRRPALPQVLAVSLAAIVSLGATDCSDEIVRRFAQVLTDHEKRITALEHQVGGPRMCGGPLVCGLGFFCETSPGCQQEIGVCSPIPEGCTLVVDPVCGCDGTTYSNDCERRMAGVSLARRGGCSDMPCEDNDDCEGDEYCHRSVGVCDAGPGVCTQRPEGCILVIDAVCGCDGSTYANGCEAAAAGASLASLDACEGGPVPLE